MDYVNTLYDKIEETLGYEENIGQIIDNGTSHRIQFHGTLSHPYDDEEKEVVLNKIKHIVATLGYSNLVSFSYESGEKHIGVFINIDIYYTFDAKEISVCPKCRDFFIANNPAQRYDVKDHEYICPMCGRDFILPNYNYKEIPRTVAEESIPFNTSKIHVVISDMMYTGTEIIPTMSITYQRTLLREGIDYFIEYCKNNIEIGTATIKLTGKWKYVGSIVKTFNILRTNIEYCRIVAPEPQIYTGLHLHPEFALYMGDYKLSEVSDFNYYYDDNVSIGLHNIIITGKGKKFYGTLNIPFNIISDNSLSPVIIFDIEDQEYTGHQITPELTVMLNGLFLIKDKDYRVTWSHNTNVGIATATLTGTGRKLDWTGTVTKNFNIVNSNDQVS